MNKRSILLVLLLLLPVLVSCGASGTTTAEESTQSADITTQDMQNSARGITETSAKELAPMAVIVLNGMTASMEGEGVTIDGNTVTITAAGSYTLSGTLTDGQIIVDADKEDTVELILNGVSIASKTSAAIFAKQSDLLIITLAEGTQSTVSDASAYVYADSAEDEPSAAVFSKDDLYVRGLGALLIYGNYKNGITSKDNLVIESGTITIEAENHGIRGKDSVTIQGGIITITAGNDGIQADNAADSGSGTVLIEGGVTEITVGHDGVQAESALTITGGEVNILAGGGYSTETYSSQESYKALKSSGTVTITGGVVSVNSLDDAIHANQSVTVTGGTLTLLSRDDGIHADDTLSITGGVINILICYEGLESAVVNISGGEIVMLAADDGINAADASESGYGDRMGAVGGWGTGDTSLQVNISGGSVIINAYGDGIDSNGNVSMSGGELYISGPVSSANGALDYDSSFTISAGVMAASGSTGMAQTPSSNSSQASAIVYFTQSQAAGASYLLTDTSGNVLISHTPDKDFQCIIFSAPGMKSGNSYELYESTDGTMDTATLVSDFTLSGTITSVGGSYGQTQTTWTQNTQPQRNNRRP